MVTDALLEDLRQNCAMTETPWARLHRIALARLSELGIQRSELQGLGGPSPAWLREIKNNEEPPSARMRPKLDELDTVLGWPSGTSWNLARGPRPDEVVAELTLNDEEDELVYRTPHPSGVPAEEQEIRDFGTMVMAALRNREHAERQRIMAAFARIVGYDA